MTQERYGQLHSHTPASDGINTIDDIVQSGIRFIAITDHDTTANVAPYTAALAQHGIDVIPGIELSIAHKGKDMHLLCYWPQIDDSAHEMLQAYQQKRIDRGLAIFEKLGTQGFTITDQMRDEVRSKGGSLSKGEVAWLVISDPTNAQRLSAEGILTPGDSVRSVDTFIKGYLRRGHPAYIPLPGMPLDDVAAKINGCFVLAHPGHDLDYQNPAHDAIIEDMARNYRVVGIESGSRKHAPAQIAHYEQLADRLGLIKTTSADAHVPAQLGKGLMLYSIVEALRAATTR